MELMQLRYFMALAQNGNMTQTAKQLFISTPALSTSIARLEQELGAPLFDRIKGRVYLNETGKLFAKYAADGLSSLDYARIQVQDLSDEANTHLTILSTATTLWNELVASFISKYPNIRISYCVTPLGDIDKRNDLNDFDLILSSEHPKLNEAMNCIYLPRTTKLRVCMPSNHRLVGRTSVHISELREERFVFPTKDRGNGETYYQLCRNSGFEPNIIVEANSYMCGYLVQNGFGITFTPWDSLEYDMLSNVVIVPLDGTIDYTMLSSCIYLKKSGHISSTAQLFLDMLLERTSAIPIPPFQRMRDSSSV